MVWSLTLTDLVPPTTIPGNFLKVNDANTCNYTPHTQFHGDCALAPKHPPQKIVGVPGGAPTRDVSMRCSIGYFDVGDGFDQGKLIHRLCVVGHRSVGVDCDGDRPHAQESERDQPEGEYRGSEHARRQRQAHGAHVIGDRHEKHHGQAEIVAGEIAGHESRQDAERCAAFLRGDHDLFHVPRFR